MNDEYRSFADLRKDHHLSQAELAEKVGVSQSTISRIEKGDLEPDLRVLSKIARELGITVKDMISKETVAEILGQQGQESFYAFCPNPFCDLNKLDKKNGSPRVSWSSGNRYASWQFNEINYCAHCGTDLVKECPSCGRQFEEPNTRFCVTCGIQITDRPTEEEWEKIRAILNEGEDDIPF